MFELIDLNGNAEVTCKELLKYRKAALIKKSSAVFFVTPTVLNEINTEITVPIADIIKEVMLYGVFPAENASEYLKELVLRAHL